MGSNSTTVTSLVARFYEQLWNAWDDTMVEATLAPGFTFRGSLGRECVGVNDWRRYRDQIRAGSSDFRNEVVELIADGERAAARLQYSGTHDGPLLGYAPTGRPFRYAGAAFFTAAHDRLSTGWVLGDLVTLRAQLSG